MKPAPKTLKGKESCWSSFCILSICINDSQYERFSWTFAVNTGFSSDIVVKNCTVSPLQTQHNTIKYAHQVSLNTTNKEKGKKPSVKKKKEKKEKKKEKKRKKKEKKKRKERKEN